jgi:two-component system phosphate regulon sensor histidine kinase PhoR
MNLSNTQDAVNLSFTNAVEKELGIRFLMMEKKAKEDFKDEVVPEEGKVLGSFEFDYLNIEKEGVISEQLSLAQQIVAFSDLQFNFSCLDSIYSSILQERGLPVLYRLIYTDSLNNIIHSIGNEVKRGFKTDAVAIIDGTKVQAIVRISPPDIIRNMAGILALSLLILALIAACLIYETRVFFTQQHLNQLRENFTHALTHDMKTPLSSIHSVLDQFKRGNLDKNPEMKGKFNEIAIEQVVKLQAMVNQVLTIAYLNNKHIGLKKEDIDLNQMIKSLITKFSVKKDKEIRFTEKYDLKNVIVYADSLYLSNAISNLIDNAIKYSGESVLIEIECTTGEKLIYIQVKDNGFGISQKDQQKIFERFERGAEIKRNYVSGFGLGLNYVKEVIEAHGGVVALSSREGYGSEFTITIPIAPAHTHIE